jgi:hypothetical protein
VIVYREQELTLDLTQGGRQTLLVGHCEASGITSGLDIGRVGIEERVRPGSLRCRRVHRRFERRFKSLYSVVKEPRTGLILLLGSCAL